VAAVGVDEPFPGADTAPLDREQKSRHQACAEGGIIRRDSRTPWQWPSTSPSRQTAP
jgi:hypothetical protein